MSVKLTAQKHYRKHTPLRSGGKQHKADLEVISKASSPMSKADNLISQRKIDVIDRRIEDMLDDIQGKRSRRIFNQEAVIALEHLLDQPMDPITQMPIWRQMLAATKGTTTSRSEYMRNARAILRQHSLYDPKTMAA